MQLLKVYVRSNLYIIETKNQNTPAGIRREENTDSTAEKFISHDPYKWPISPA